MSIRVEVTSSYLSAFSDDVLPKEKFPGVIEVIKLYSKPTSDKAPQLVGAISEQVARLGRLRVLIGEPFAIENAVEPKSYLLDLSTLAGPLHKILEASSNHPIFGKHKARASIATLTGASLKQTEENNEILKIERTALGVVGNAVKHTRSAYGSDCYDFVFEHSQRL